MFTTEVFKLNIEEISCSEYDAAYFLMSEDRRKRCDAYSRESDKKLCVGADMLVRSVLSKKTGIDKRDICYYTTDKGKPYCLYENCFFSVSHSGNMIVAAFDDEGEIGIDIEKMQPFRSGVARHILADSEKTFVFEVNSPGNAIITDEHVIDRFFRVWTYKEAYVKMTGEGITDNICNVLYDERRCLCEISDGYCITVINKKCI